MIESFTIGAYLFKDARGLTQEQDEAISVALRDGLQLVPGGDRCEARGLDSSGEYPILRFGVFENGTLVGAWWLGCNRLTTRSTARNIRVRSVPLPGLIPEQTEFFNVRNLVSIGKWFLANKLKRRDGGSVQVASLSITYDPTNKGHGPLSEDSRDEAAKLAGVDITTASKNGRSEATFKLTRAPRTRLTPKVG